MDKPKNITAASGAATVRCSVSAETVQRICDCIDKQDGLLTKATTARHLSHLLMGMVEDHFGHDKGTRDRGARTFVVSEMSLATLTWLASEVWSAADDIGEQLDEMDGDLVEISNASFDARQAAGA